MHINKINSNKIVAMLLCILLLSNFILNIGCVYATEIETKYLWYDSDFEAEASTSNEKVIVKFADGERIEEDNSRIYLYPKETGVYTITVIGKKEGSNKDEQLRYALFNLDNGQYDFVRLAARYNGASSTLLTGNMSSDSTTIDVILNAESDYYIDMVDTALSGVTIIVQKRGIERYAMTNVPAVAVSAKLEAQKGPDGIVYNRTKGVAGIDGLTQVDLSTMLEEPPIGLKVIEFTDDQMVNYYQTGVDAIEEEDKGGGALEGILADIVLAIGTVFMRIVEWAIGSNVSLTIDNILFNRMDQLVIDLTPLGGIKISASDPTIGKGVFNNEVVGDIISQLFNALKTLAITIYIVMLLYIGVKILLSVGTKDQGKALKYLEYWITGLIILVTLPYFLPAIPAVSNAIVGLMEKEAENMNSTYTIEEILEKLGEDASLLGEDAEVEAYDRALKKEIERLEELMQGTPETREEAQATIDAKIEEALSKFNSMSPSSKQKLEEKINAVIAIIDENFGNWSEVNESEYETAINDISDFIYAHSSTSEIFTEIVKTFPPNVSANQSVYIQIQKILSYIKDNTSDPQLDFWVTNELRNLRGLMNATGFGAEYAECEDIILRAKDEFVEYANSDAFTGLKQMFENYKNAVIYEEIAVLEDMRDNLRRDIMFTLKRRAKVENRFVYAVAWVILLYQTFAMLFMYYRRIFAVIILIIIFPIIMAFYVFDKLSDGKSQALATWIKEFLATMLVQILHAAVYIIIINIGIDACAIDPTKNWFFLVLAVCFLFPGERIVRGLIGLGGSSTLGELKNNFGGLAMAGYAVSKTYKSAKSFKNEGGIQGKLDKMKQEKEKEKQKKQAEEEKKKKKKSDLQKSKDRNREYRNMVKQDKTDARKERIRNNTASGYDRFREGASNAKKTINGFKAVQKAKVVGGKVIKGATTVGKAGLKGAKFVGKVGSVGFKYGKKAYNAGKKAVGLTMGAVEGMENFSQGGAASALGTAYGVAKSYGTFGKDKKVASKKQTQKQSTAPVKYKSKYKNGEKVSNGDSPSGTANRSGSSRTTSSTTQNRLNRIRTTYNYEDPVIRNNTSGNSNAGNNSSNNGGNNNP